MRGRYGYDSVGNKIRQRDARNEGDTRWEYDHLGRVVSRTLPGTFNNGSASVFLTESFA